jgi:hypothetical protein
VLVSSSLRDVVAGSSLGFADRGTHRLKGIEGEWRLFAVTAVDGAGRQAPLDTGEAAKRRLGIEPREASSRSRRPLLIAALLLLVLAVGVVAFVASREGEETAGPSGPSGPSADPGPAPGSIAKLDLRTGELLLDPDAPQSSTPQFENEDLEIGEGSVWLIRGSNLFKIDPEDGSVLPAAGGVSTVGNQGLDTGFGSVWLLHDDLFPVAPGTGAVGEPVGLLDLDPDVRVTDVGAGLDRVWVVTVDGALFRVEPSSMRVAEFPLGGTTEHLAVGTDAVWITDEFEGVVLRFDPASEEVVDRIELSGGLDAIAVGEGSAWVLDTTLGTLTPIDEADGDAKTPIDVGSDAEDVFVGDGSIWVASGGSILEINPVTLQIVRTIQVGPTPILEVAVDGVAEAIWISLKGAG